MSKKEKLSKLIGLRLAPVVALRLARHASERGEEPVDIIRRGLVAELDKLDAQIPDATRVELNKLADAGLSLAEVVQDSIDRKRAEDAQMEIPVVAAVGGGR